MAREAECDCYCLSIDYGQRTAPLAARVAARSARAFSVLRRSIRCVGVALTDTRIAVPISGIGTGIPVTYVPARNTIMLSLALAWAEVLGARDIFFGTNAVYSPSGLSALICRIRNDGESATKGRRRREADAAYADH
jgi:7-cyano-7-deazaguanine synthase